MKELERPNPGEWKRARQLVCGLSDELPPGSRIPESQNHPVNSAISVLEVEPPNERLRIARPRLRLDTQTPVGPDDHRVPRTLITRGW